MSVFGSQYRCEQLRNLMKNVKSRARTILTDEHLQGCMQIAATEMKTNWNITEEGTVTPH
jgi:hypothetical protein